MQEITQHIGDLAVLGISCRFPGSEGYRQYWRSLAAGEDAVREIPPERWPAGEFYSRDPGASNASVSKWGGFLDRIDEFDHRFFNISPREAKAMDPRQRILLEEVWCALEDSTLSLERLRKMRTAVFVGMMSLDESAHLPPVDGYAGSGSAGCMLANRISHFFDFSGPSLGIDTASSSSLVALHQAKEALLSGHADYALVAGISLNQTPWKYISFSKARMLSPDGRCKAFDRSANGYAPGEGVGVIILQRADRAATDGNFVHGIVKGSAVNHGGLSVSLTAPQVAAQRDVIERAHSDAGVSPESITYVEAHGSGTPLGDPIEVEALVQAFRSGTHAEQFCHLGSVKTNIGHLEPAAGIAGVIKVLVMMKHRSIPASLHLRAPNPMLDLARSPFMLVDRLIPWPGGSGPLRAGVSSFGFGGVNSHVVMESAPEKEPSTSSDSGESDRSLLLPFILSARTPSSLRALVESWLAFVKTEEFERSSWRDICGTLLGRKAFDSRAAWWVSKRGLERALLAGPEFADSPSPVQPLGLALGSLADFERGQVEDLVGKVAHVRIQWGHVCENLAEACGKREVREAAEFSALFWDSRPALWEMSVGLLLARMARLWLPGISLVTGEGLGLQTALCVSGMLGESAALRRALNLAGPIDDPLGRPRLAFFDPSSEQMIWPVEIPADYLPELFAQAVLRPSDQRDLIRRAGELAEHQPTFRKFLEGWQVPLEQAGENLWDWWKDAGAERVEKGPGARVSLAALVAGDALRRLNRKWDLGRRGLPAQPRFLEALALLGAGLVEPKELVRFFKGGKKEAVDLARMATVRARGMKNADRFPLLASLIRRPLEAGPLRPELVARPLQPDFFSANLVVRAGKLRHQAPSGLSFVEPGDDLSSQLGQSLVSAWRAGAAVAWEHTPWADNFSRLPLPSYCFDRTRFGREPVPAPFRAGASDGAKGTPWEEGFGGIERLQDDLSELLVGILRVERGEVDEKMDLREHGMESVALTDFAESIGRRYGMELDPVLLYEHPNLRSLARYLFAAFPAKFGEGAPPNAPLAPAGEPSARPAGAARQVMPESVPLDRPAPRPAHANEEAPREFLSGAIAIIGMACRFPKAANPAQFWENLAAGANLVTEVPSDRWRWQDYFGDPHNGENKTLSRWGGFVADAGSFDAAFFKISPKEAELMDPQQRWMLELVWEALEDAGYPPSELRGSPTGVFVGVCNNDYQVLVEKRHSRSEAHTATGGHFSIIPNRVSYFFDWRGPSMAVDTACSSSLVALDAAVRALQRGDCALAVAGGVNLCCVPGPYLSFDHAGMLSKDGRCKAFDRSANGYVRGEGAGIVLLKPLAQAVADGDQIHAVVRATAVNHGGGATSLTAPNPNAQADLLIQAYRAAGISPATVGYIEAHGTGTKLGDPIEVAGLKKAFSELARVFGDPPVVSPYCALGSVKANIGHLESAAGIAGVVKTVLALRHKVIPGLVHFESLNPQIDLDGSAFFIAKESAPWRPTRDPSGNALPLRAGVSSFGFGGANGHVVLEEFPERASPGAADEPPIPELFPFSARTAQQLKESVFAMAFWLETAGAGARVADVAHTLQVGREALEWRLVVIASGRRDLQERLGQFLAGEEHPRSLFRGQGAGSSGVGRLDEAQEDREFCLALARKGRLEQLARFWAAGSRFAWRDLFPARGRRRISLPTYPFSKERFWVAESRDAMPENASAPSSGFLLEKTWREWPLPPEREAAADCYLAIVDGGEAERVWEELRREPGKSWVVVRRGAVSLEKRPGEWELPLGDGEGGIRAGKVISGLFPHIRGIFHLASGPAVEAAGAVELGAISLYQCLLDAAGESAFSIVLATQGIQPWRNPSPGMRGAALTGLVRMLGAEYRGLRARAVDLERGDNPPEAARKLWSEMGVRDSVGEVCYRQGVRFGPALAPFPEAKSDGPFQFDPSRVYVISGGTGGIGLGLAEYASSRGARKLVLMSRQSLPDRDEWSAILSGNGESTALAEKIRRLCALEDKGVSVALTSIPLTARQELSAFFNRVRLEYGEIGGVVHCAGQMALEPLRFLKKPVSDFARMTSPKIEGIESLARLFDECDLQFFVLFSSVAALAPALGAGFSDYAMANGFLDFFAGWQRSRGRAYFRSVNWPLWERTGMGQISRPKHEASGVDSLSLGEGLSLFGRILSLSSPGEVFPGVNRRAELPSDALLGLPLPGRPTPRPENSAPAAQVERGLHARVTAAFAKTLRVDPHRIDPAAHFEDLGIDSILLSELTRELDKVLGVPLDPSLLLEYKTIELLVACLESRLPQVSAAANTPPPAPAAARSGEPKARDPVQPTVRAELRPAAAHQGGSARAVALIGLGCRFPGAGDPLALWENLRAARSSVGEVPASRWSQWEFYSEEPTQGKTISKWGGFVDGIEDFDADFFHIPEADAPEMDPLVRLFLEATVQAVRDAGYDEASIGGTRTGVFVGSRISGYGERIREYKKNTIAGIGQNFIAAHVSKFFDFKGPCFVLDSACSSSLTSAHLACQSLLGGECEIAVAGGVDVLLDERMYLLLTEAKALSPDGRCHTFDLKANGYVPGEGAGAVVMKTLDRALADGDSIYGVILASAINNDGRTMGITTPSLESQRELVERTLSLAGVDPDSIGYVETHGTGTMIGDPIELKALSRAFRKQTAELQFCALGSVKTNLGHLHSAAGIASLIKVALGLRHREIVASLNCDTPNPRFDFAASPFFPNVQLRPWPLRGNCRRAGISSFGFGGSNGHMIVEEFDAAKFPAYVLRRRALPPARFLRKRFWLEPAARGAPGPSEGPRAEVPEPFLVLQEESSDQST